jgi:hypothetical protein
LLGACGLLFFIAPPLMEVLPEALVRGISHVSLHFNLPGIVVCSALAVGCAVGRRGLAVALVMLGMAVAVGDVIWRVYPVLDRELTGRPLWLQHLESNQGQAITCLPPMNRSQRDSTRYYVDQNLPDCR